jgi:hypothetical protein
MSLRMGDIQSLLLDRSFLMRFMNNQALNDVFFL